MASYRLHLLLGLLLFHIAGTGVFAKNAMQGMKFAKDLRQQRADRLQKLGYAPTESSSETLHKREALITFNNPKAKEFYVDGTKIPDGMYRCDV